MLLPTLAGIAAYTPYRPNAALGCSRPALLDVITTSNFVVCVKGGMTEGRTLVLQGPHENPLCMDWQCRGGKLGLLRRATFWQHLSQRPGTREGAARAPVTTPRIMLTAIKGAP